jgi:hypothetical protein
MKLLMNETLRWKTERFGLTTELIMAFGDFLLFAYLLIVFCVNRIQNRSSKEVTKPSNTPSIS